jgi:hypothetical protein
MQQITALRSQYGAGTPVHFTGHSKGGALAFLATMKLNFFENITPASTYTYAAPKCGNPAFVTAYNALFQRSTTRYEFYDDLVPWIPPTQSFIDDFAEAVGVISTYLADLIRRELRGWDYHPCGTGFYITRQYQIELDTPTLDVERMAEIAWAFVTGNFSQFVSSHSPMCGGGYMTAIAPTNVCPNVTDLLMAVSARHANVVQPASKPV